MTVQPYPDLGAVVVLGDCVEKMKLLPDGCVDAVVCDPPYAIEFMARSWDKHQTPLAFQEWCQQWAEQCFRLLKPGGHLLAFGGTRTFHRLAVGIEDAGFEIRDSIAWAYGSGFPKSMDVSKAIDKAAGAKREDLGPGQWAHVKAGGTWNGLVYGDEPAHGRGPRETAPATDAAAQWQGWGTALKPAYEPIVVARKPLAKKKHTVAANVLEYGTGALNIDGTRIASEDPNPSIERRKGANGHLNWSDEQTAHIAGRIVSRTSPERYAEARAGEELGRWPANLVLDTDQAAVLDEQSGPRKSGGKVKGTEDSTTGQNGIYGHFERVENKPYGDSGGASRFFLTVEQTLDELPARFLYQPKAPRKERPSYVDDDGKTVGHPTVKPLALMRWLIRLVTPPGGKVLDPFAGSGTTLEAAVIERFDSIGMELTEEYLPLIDQRMLRQRVARAAADDTEAASA